MIEAPKIAPDGRLADLAEYLTYVEQIEEDIAWAKVRLEHVHDARLRRLSLRDIARLKARRIAELRRIGSELRSYQDLAFRLDLVLSIPGIGKRTALALIVRMPELGQVSREEAPRLPVLLPTTTIAESTKASDGSPAAGADYGARFIPRRCRRPSVGTRRSSRSTAA